MDGGRPLSGTGPILLCFSQGTSCFTLAANDTIHSGTGWSQGQKKWGTGCLECGVRREQVDGSPGIQKSAGGDILEGRGRDGRGMGGEWRAGKRSELHVAGSVNDTLVSLE